MTGVVSLFHTGSETTGRARSIAEQLRPL